METRSAGKGLETAVQQIVGAIAATVWLAYEVEAPSQEITRLAATTMTMATGIEVWCGQCNLEKRPGDSVVRDRIETLPSSSKQPSQVIVLLRVDQKRVMRIRLASSNCTLDAGGLRVVWLTDVKPAESVDLLARYVREDGHARDGDRLAEQARHGHRATCRSIRGSRACQLLSLPISLPGCGKRLRSGSAPPAANPA